jgi:hypothetical protein
MTLTHVTVPATPATTLPLSLMQCRGARRIQMVLAVYGVEAKLSVKRTRSSSPIVENGERGITLSRRSYARLVPVEKQLDFDQPTQLTLIAISRCCTSSGLGVQRNGLLASMTSVAPVHGVF